MQPVFLRAPNITCVHAFSTRHGGVSQEPFGTLNLGGTDDVQEHINENRRRFITALGCDVQRVDNLDKAIDYATKSLPDMLNMECFVVPDEFRRDL